MFLRFSPGFRFKNNRLHIFGQDSVILIDGWPELKSVRKTASSEAWRPFNPDFRLIYPYRRKAVRKRLKVLPDQMELGFDVPVSRPPSTSLASQKKRAFDAFRFSVPKPVAARVDKFTNRQWNLLKLLEMKPMALEVCRSNAALTFAVANLANFRKLGNLDSLRFAADHILDKQRDLLSCIDFPGTQSSVKVLAKTVPESVCPENLLLLRNLIREDTIGKVLSHLPKINFGILELLSLHPIRNQLPMSLLEQVAQSPAEKYRSVVANCVRESLFMMEQLELKVSPRDFASIDRIQAQNRQLTEDFCKLEAVRKCNRRFPMPPIPGTAGIVPIRTEWELIREGREQSNCVASYADRVINRNVYIYRVLEPERCTLSIYQASDRAWELDQLKTRFNGNPARATMEVVHVWLERFGMAF